MKVKLSTQTVEVEKLKLSQYAEVLSVIEKIPALLGDYAGKSNDEFFADLPRIIGSALPELMKVIEVATPLTLDEVDDLGLDEAVELLKAVFEVNGIGRVVQNLTKMFQSSQLENGSTPSSISTPPSTAGANPPSSTSTPTKLNS